MNAYLASTAYESVESGEAEGGDTRTSLIDVDLPTHVCESNCSEAADRASADYDEFSCHGGRVGGWHREDALDPHPHHLTVAYLRGYYGMKKLVFFPVGSTLFC